MGWVDKNLGSYTYGLYFLSLTSILSAALIAVLPLRQPAEAEAKTDDSSKAR